MPLFKKDLITQNADGFDIAAGTPTPRTLDVNGGDVEIQGAGTTVTHTLPASTCTLASLDLAETFQNKRLGSGTEIVTGTTDEATGSLYYKKSDNTFEALPAPTSGQFLGEGSGLPAWQTGSVPYRTIYFSSGGTSVTSTRWLGHDIAETDIEHTKRIMPACEIVAMFCARENTTAEGKFNIHKNGSFVTGATASITSTNTTANVTGLSISFNGTTDFIAVEMEEVGAGPTSGAYQCLIYYVASNP